MALLDLQGMETPQGPRGHSDGKSAASKHCGGGGISGLSLLLC